MNASRAWLRVREPCLFNVKLTFGRGGGIGAEPSVDPRLLPTPASHVVGRNVSVLRIENVFDGAFERGEPGTWYYDRAAAAVYYRPRTGENGSSLQGVLPVLEQVGPAHWPHVMCVCCVRVSQALRLSGVATARAAAHT